MLRTLTIIGFTCFPGFAAADALLDRMEAAAETINEMMGQAMLNDMPFLEGKLPETEWDAEYREIGQCMLEAYVAEVGRAETTAMIGRMETILETLEITSMEDMTNMPNMQPEGMTEAQSAAIASDCGVVDITMRRMRESGMMEAMQAANN